MNQIIPIGKGVLVAIEKQINPDRLVEFRRMWQAEIPDVPCFVISEAQVVDLGDNIAMFQFTGNVSPTLVAEFQRWWEEVSRGSD